MAKVKSVLLVCTGNSCRSVMAEGLLKKALKNAGKADIEVKSAGVSAIDGMHPAPETIEVMKKAGVDVSHFTSKNLTDEAIKKADLILVMSSHHMDNIIAKVPEAASKVHLLKQFGNKNVANACEDMDITDPIGKPLKVYEDVFSLIKKEVDRIASLL